MRKASGGWARSVPAANSLQLTPETKIEGDFDCFRGLSRFSIEGNLRQITGSIRGDTMVEATTSHYKILEKRTPRDLRGLSRS